jgi:restriction endonuclease S subunit
VISLTRSIISSGLKVALVPKEWDNSLVNQRVAVIKQRKKMDIHFLYTYLSSDTAFNYVRDKSKSLMQPNLSVNALKAFLVPLPPYEIQKQIVGKIEVEHVLVESAKKLIEIYEQKTKDTVDKLWHD